MSPRKSQIDILASLTHPRTLPPQRKRFVMFEAYFDESGIHDEAAVCVVGGYYGHQALWRKFERQWNKIINSYPELIGPGFHAKKFFARDKGKRVGPYKEWTDEKAEKFLERLVECIVRNSIFPIGFGIVVSDFLALPLLSRKWFTGAKFDLSGKPITSGCPEKPYYVPFSYCVLHSTRMTSGADQFYFYAGLDRAFSEYATTLYKHLLEDQRLPASLTKRFGGISYPLAKQTPGLQAADLLANRMYQRSLRIVSGTADGPPKLLVRLTKNARSGQGFTLFDATFLRNLEERGEQAYEMLRRTGKVGSYLQTLRKL